MVGRVWSKKLIIILIKFCTFKERMLVNMLLNLKKEKVCVNKIVGQKLENIIVEGDVIVPDIKPDILNTINTSGTICIYKREAMDR